MDHQEPCRLRGERWEFHGRYRARRRRPLPPRGYPAIKGDRRMVAPQRRRHLSYKTKTRRILERRRKDQVHPVKGREDDVCICIRLARGTVDPEDSQTKEKWPAQLRGFR